MFNNVFSKTVPFVGQCGKIPQSQPGHMSVSYGARELLAGHLRPPSTRARTHTHTHTTYVIVIAFLQQQWLRKRHSMSRYEYLVCLVELKWWFDTRDGAA